MFRPAGGAVYSMSALLWLPPIVRALTTALLVVAASAAAESFGPVWGALIASLPVSAGPAYVFLALRHGDAFVADGALGSCVANASTGLFLIVYGMTAARLPSRRSLGCATLAWLAASAAAAAFTWSAATATALNLVVYTSGFALLALFPPRQTERVIVRRRRWFELPVRAAAVALFVTLLLGVSGWLGSRASGFAAVFPISLISLLVIARPRLGGTAAASMAASALRAMLGFGLMLLVLHETVLPWGAPAAFAAALSVSLGWSAALLAWERYRAPAVSPPR